MQSTAQSLLALSSRKAPVSLVKVGLSLALFAVVVHHASPAGWNLEAQLKSLNFWTIAIGLHLVVTLLTALRWRLIQNKVAPAATSPFPFFWVSWSSQFVGLFFFGILGTDAARAYSLRRWGLAPKAIAEVILRDRLASVFGLLFLIALGFTGSWVSPEYWWPLLACGLLISAFHPVFFLSVTSQGLKVLMIGALAQWTLLSMGGEAWRQLGLGLLTEVLPISWEGFGLGHWTFGSLLSQGDGAGIYNTYFAAKIFFKWMGVAPLILLIWKPPRTHQESVKIQNARGPFLPLLFALRTQIQKDDTPDRATQFGQRLLHQNFGVRALHSLLQKSPAPIKTAAALLYAAAVSAKPLRAQPGQPLALVRFANEKSAVQTRHSLFEEFNLSIWDWTPRFATALYSFSFLISRAAYNPTTALRLTRLFARLVRRYPLYVAWRAGESLMTTLFLQERWRARPPRFVVVATEGNPHGLAAMAAAEAVGTPALFISHGAISLNPISLRCRWAVVYGARAQKDFSRGGSRVGTFILEGFKERWTPPIVRERPRLLIALGHAPNLPSVQELIDRNDGAEIVVRAHPHSQVPASHIARALRGPSLRFSQGAPLAEDLREVRCAYAGNSTVHLEVLLMGVPSVYEETLDEQRERRLTFLEEGLIYRGPLGVPLEDFYARPEWREEFAGYINIQKTSAESQEELRSCLRAGRTP